MASFSQITKRKRARRRKTAGRARKRKQADRSTVTPAELFACLSSRPSGAEGGEPGKPAPANETAAR